MRMAITTDAGFHRIVSVYYFTVKHILIQPLTLAVYGGAMHISYSYVITYNPETMFLTLIFTR